MLYDYPDYRYCRSFCNLDLTILPGGTALVIYAERPGKPGASVTNRAEFLATKVCRENTAIDPRRLTWIEHDPQRGSRLNPRPPTWSLMMDAHKLENRLDAIAGDAAEQACYLIAGNDAEKWEGNECEIYVCVGCEFCTGCIDAIMTLINRKVGTDGDEKGVFSGWSDGESDTPKACCWCGCLLHYTLTDHGASQEMDHYQEYSPDAPMSPGDAYALARILGSGSAQPDFVAKAAEWLAAHEKAQTIS